MKLEDVKVVLCDIDDTITTFKGGYNASDYVNEIFAMFAKNHSIVNGKDMFDARDEVDAFAENLIWWDYPDFIAEFQLPADECWISLHEIHANHLAFFEDAVVMIKRIHECGIPLCIVSNNPLSGCIMKLAVANLADDLGSRYFTRYFGTNICRGMKGQPAMWLRVLSSLSGIDPADVLMVGDSVKEDFELPCSMGIGRSVIVDRSSDVPEEQRKGYFAVNDLRLLEFK